MNDWQSMYLPVPLQAGIVWRPCAHLECARPKLRNKLEATDENAWRHLAPVVMMIITPSAAAARPNKSDAPAQQATENQ
jgi:hypothetical protein